MADTPYRRKLESLGFIARDHRTKTTVVYDDDRGGGRIAGYQTEHKDGRVDATITPPCTHLKARPGGAVE